MDKKPGRANAETIKHLKNETEHFISVWNRPKHLFKIDTNRAALVVIDMQNFVCAPEHWSSMAGMEEVVKNTNKLVDLCHAQSIPVIWVRHNINSTGDSTKGGLYHVFHNKEHLKSVENYATSTEIYDEMHFNSETDYRV